MQTIQKLIKTKLEDCAFNKTAYAQTHINRYIQTVNTLMSVVKPGDSILDVGSYGNLLPALLSIDNDVKITCTGAPRPNQTQTRLNHTSCSTPTKAYSADMLHFDINEPFPIVDAQYDGIIFTEVLEHLTKDPVGVLAEMHRILKPNGWILITTPNSCGTNCLVKLLHGSNPVFFGLFTKTHSTDRHNREYSLPEVKTLLNAVGFSTNVATTETVYSLPKERQFLVNLCNLGLGVLHMVTFGYITARYRGDTIFVIARKTGILVDRHPAFLYV